MSESRKAQLARYARMMTAFRSGRERTLAQLAVMCMLAADGRQLINMPPEWGWPPIPDDD